MVLNTKKIILKMLAYLGNMPTTPQTWLSKCQKIKQEHQTSSEQQANNSAHRQSCTALRTKNIGSLAIIIFFKAKNSYTGASNLITRYNQMLFQGNTLKPDTKKPSLLLRIKDVVGVTLLKCTCSCLYKATSKPQMKHRELSLPQSESF